MDAGYSEFKSFFSSEFLPCQGAVKAAALFYNAETEPRVAQAKTLLTSAA